MDRDSNLGSQVPESESREGPGHQRGNRRKVEKDNPSSIKKRARDIERLLNKKGDGLPADTRINLQRELAAHWERIHQHEDKKKRAKMISRYHQVRFFGKYERALSNRRRVRGCTLNRAHLNPQSAKRQTA